MATATPVVNLPTLYSLKEFAELVELNRYTLLHWISQGKWEEKTHGVVRLYRIGNQWKVPGVDIERFIEKCQVEGPRILEFKPQEKVLNE